ncbi:MAG: hypothetical protein RLY35_104 [Bacteroidota bacterium]
MQKIFLSTLFILATICGMAQSGKIFGKVTDQITGNPLAFAPVAIQGTGFGALSNDSGYYEITNLKPGLYNVECTFLGYQKFIQFEVEVTNARSAVLNIALSPDVKLGKTLEIVGSNITNRDESPISVRSIGANEIKRNPGGNRDISRAIRSLPGVAAIPSFRNDIIIRGGASSENRFYIDGIEIPNINHFATQGASGGPVGMINVDLISKVQFYSGAFPAMRGNAMSSVFEFDFKEARRDKATVNAVLGTSDLGITFETPTGKNSGLLVSARRSYLQGLFSILGLPFLPIYNDINAKWKWDIDKKNKLTFIAIGAYDQFELNLKAAEDTSAESFLENKYILDYLGIFEQWSYSTGLKYEHLKDNGNWTVVLSRNQLQNDNYKYYNNDASLPKKYDYRSNESENKFRAERRIFGDNGWKVSYGVAGEWAQYRNNSFTQVYLLAQDSLVNLVSNTKAGLFKYGGFAQVSKTMLENKLVLSYGARMDGNNWGNNMKNPLEQFSPRFSARYSFAPQWTLNANTGIYYQLPAYTALAYTDNSGAYVNKDIRYIQNKQWVAGVEYDWQKRNSVITVEGFYKRYDRYPISQNLGVSLANLGADFGVVGNEALSSNGLGRAYGAELLFQQKLFNNAYGILAYTWVRSEFTNANGQFAPSSWDSRHIISLTGGKKFGKNWEIGGRFAFSGGLPYSPDNVEASMQTFYWDQFGFAQTNWQLVNTKRISIYHQLDIRIDKKWFFKKWSLNAFLDIQNIYGYATQTKPALDVQRNANGSPIVDPNDSSRYLPQVIPQNNGFTQPAIGIIVEL